MDNVSKKQTIQTLVNTAVESFATGFRARHEGEVDDPEGTINMKVHNVFIEALGKDIQYYTALVRSFDSALGSMLETLAIRIATLSFEVRQDVSGPLSIDQTRTIAELLEKYKSREKKSEVAEYWNFVCRSKYGYQWVSEGYRNVISKMKFRKNRAEMALWQGLTQNTL